jgi:hypothetical protein
VAGIAAECGHRAILEMAQSKGLAQPELTLLGAIATGNLEFLKIAHSANPDSVPRSAIVFAAAHAFHDGVRYLNRHGHGHGFPLWPEGQLIDAEGLSALRANLRRFVCAPQSKTARRERLGIRRHKDAVDPLKCTWEMAATRSSVAAQSSADEQVFLVEAFES